jgi:hypothetical protein
MAASLHFFVTFGFDFVSFVFFLAFRLPIPGINRDEVLESNGPRKYFFSALQALDSVCLEKI